MLVLLRHGADLFEKSGAPRVRRRGAADRFSMMGLRSPAMPAIGAETMLRALSILIGYYHTPNRKQLAMARGLVSVF